MKTNDQKPGKVSRRYRHTEVLLLGGVRFIGTLKELQVVHELLAKKANALEAAKPQLYPAGTGKAREELLQRLRSTFERGAEPDVIARWLDQQK